MFWNVIDSITTKYGLTDFDAPENLADRNGRSMVRSDPCEKSCFVSAIMSCKRCYVVLCLKALAL